jgi:hypothetical protein
LACLSIFLFVGVIFKAMNENTLDRLKRKRKIAKGRKEQIEKKKQNNLGT